MNSNEANSAQQPYFIFLNSKHETPTQKLINVSEQSETAFSELNNETISSGIYNQLNKNLYANQDKSYNKVIYQIRLAMAIHMHTN